MGFYPVTPAINQYVIGSPLFKKITVELENGKKLTVNAPGNSSTNTYVNKVDMNGKSHSKSWFSHTDIMQGATINFSMSATPNKQRGISEADFPYSFSKDK